MGKPHKQLQAEKDAQAAAKAATSKHADEAARLGTWRTDKLCAVGFTESEAIMVLTSKISPGEMSVRVDKLCGMVKRGCSTALALEIIQ